MKLIVEEDGISQRPWPVLQRQRDQVAESTTRQCVLAREKPVVGPHAEFVSSGHGLSYEVAAHLACGGGRYRG